MGFAVAMSSRSARPAQGPRTTGKGQLPADCAAPIGPAAGSRNTLDQKAPETVALLPISSEESRAALDCDKKQLRSFGFRALDCDALNENAPKTGMIREKPINQGAASKQMSQPSRSCLD